MEEKKIYRLNPKSVAINCNVVRVFITSTVLYMCTKNYFLACVPIITSEINTEPLRMSVC